MIDNTLPNLAPPQPRLSKGWIIGIVIFFILMLAVITGVYLVSQRTNLLPKAQSPKTKISSPSLILKENGRGENGEVLAISVVFKSEVDPINLVSTNITFSKEKLEVESITNPGEGKKVLDQSFNNEDGTINLLLGLPNPGVKTEPGKEYIVAVINFKAKQAGETSILQNNSQLVRNQDNINIIKEKNNLNLSIPVELAAKYTPACITRPACLDAKPACKIAEPVEGWCDASEEGFLRLISPEGGEVYSANQQIPITWEADGLSRISISLLLNDEVLGSIGEATASAKQFLWSPLKTLPIAYINEVNTFKIEISSDGKQSSSANKKAKSRGPFGIITSSDTSKIATNSAQVALEKRDLNSDSRLDLMDLSKLLSNYGKSEPKYDLNGDHAINDVDFYLLKGLIN